jgi:uncharacterized protein YdeI (YjbR/CyaY-like superfamily)
VSDPVFFRSAAEFRRWLQKNHDKASEIFVGFYKKDSGAKGITYSEALDEALCFGWIDGVRRRVDERSFTNRFSPRTKRSNWSAINIKRMGELLEAGRVASPGKQAFESRDVERAKQYSYERATCELPPAYKKIVRARPAAWKFLEAQSPYYRRLACWYVMSAKKEETRLARLRTLIDTCASGRRLEPMSSKKA